MIKLLRQRRTIRKFTNGKIDPGETGILKEALLRAPSSKNINPWEFIFIEDKDVIGELKKCRPNGVTSLETSPLVVVVCADETKNDVWIEDCAIASIIVQLTAQSVGLGSCWIQVRNRWHSEKLSTEEYIQKLLKIPDNFRILNMVAIGHPAQKREGKRFEELQFEKIRFDGF